MYELWWSCISHNNCYWCRPPFQEIVQRIWCKHLDLAALWWGWRQWISSADLLYLLSWLESRFENSRFQNSNFNPIKSKSTAFIKKNLQSSTLSDPHCILLGISGVVLRLLLIAVAFCTSRDVHHLASWLQIPAEGSGLEHIHTRNCSCSFALPPIAVPFSPLLDLTKPYGWWGQPGQAWGGGGLGGEPTNEPAPPLYEVRSTSSAHGNEFF